MEWSRDILEELRVANFLVRSYTGINKEERTYIGIIVPFSPFVGVIFILVFSSWVSVGVGFFA